MPLLDFLDKNKFIFKIRNELGVSEKKLIKNIENLAESTGCEVRYWDLEDDYYRFYVERVKNA